MAWKVEYNDMDSQMMDDVKRHTGQKTASKAIIYMLGKYVPVCEALEAERVRVRQLELELRNLKRAVSNKILADERLSEIINGELD